MDRYKIGSGTLSLIMERYHAGGIPIEELQMMPPKEVELLFYPQENIPGYKEIAENIYENSEVYPVAYVTSQYLSEEDYNTLEFPYNQTAFLDFAVVKTEVPVPDGRNSFNQRYRK